MMPLPCSAMRLAHAPTPGPYGGSSLPRATDAGARRAEVFLLIEVAIQDNGRFGGVIREGAHARASSWIVLFELQQGGPKQVVILQVGRERRFRYRPQKTGAVLLSPAKNSTSS